MKKPKYPTTPMRNCQYCKHYNAKSNTCTAPKADQIANFNPRDDIDCWLLKYDKSEIPETNDVDFTETYCKGKKCPFYYSTLNLCTRPSKCPYKNVEEKTTFNNVKFDKDLS